MLSTSQCAEDPIILVTESRKDICWGFWGKKMFFLLKLFILLSF